MRQPVRCGWRARSILTSISVIVATLLIAGCNATAPDSPVASEDGRGNLDLVLLVDLSKSMRGVGSDRDIFGRVQQTAKDIVRELEPGDAVSLLTFADTVRAYPTITIQSDTERERFFTLVDELEAEGNWTYTAAALNAALEEASRLEATFPDHPKLVLLLTDGINDPPPAAGERLTLEAAARLCAGQPFYVFQVQYGGQIDEELDRQIRQYCVNGGTRTDRDVEAGINAIRPIIEEVTGSVTHRWRPDPKTFELTLDELSEPVESVVTVRLPEALEVAPAASLDRGEIPDLLGLELSRQLGPDQMTLTLTARLESQVENEDFEGAVTVQLPEAVPGLEAEPVTIPVIVRTRLVPPTWPYWAGGVVVAGVLALVAWLLARRRSQRQLFGSLECWIPGETSRKVKVSLESLGANAVIGSKQIPTGDDRDLASLFVTTEKGERLVTVSGLGENRVIFKDKAVANLRLYNNDSFNVGSWEFRYRGDTDYRPRAARGR